MARYSRNDLAGIELPKAELSRENLKQALELFHDDEVARLQALGDLGAGQPDEAPLHAAKLDPAAPADWQEYYSNANRRRRELGWHRRGDESKPRKRRLNTNRLLAIVMGLATLAVILCLVIPI